MNFQKNRMDASPAPDSTPADPIATSQRAHRKIMDFSVDVICTIDKKGIFLKVSAASQKLFGYAPKELEGIQSGHLVHLDDKLLTHEAFSQIMNGLEVTYFENRFYRKDGTIIPLVWSARWDAEDQIMYCIARNGQEKKKVEQERLKKVQQMARIGGWEYDLVNHRTHWVSDQLYSIYGISRELYPEISIPVFLSLVHPDDCERVMAELSDSVALQNFYTEHRIVRPNGQEVYVRQSVEVIFENDIPVLLKGVVQDITNSRLADQLLVANERRFRTLVQNGFDMISILDDEGNYLYAADSVYRILGYNPKELVGKNAFDFIHPDDVIRIAKSFTRLYTDTYIEDVEPFRFRNSKGEWRWLESNAINMLHDTAIDGFVINSRDITDKKIMQERFDKQIKEWQKRMNKATIQAQEQERAQLGRELHDNVNQVLTTVKLYTELCLDQHPDQQLLLEKAANYLSDCINEIRTISKRLSSPTLGEISLSDSIKELVGSLKLTNKLQINLSVNADHSKISQDVHLGVYRIIQEHMTNILKHAEAKRVHIVITVCDTYLTVNIKDDGKGFNVDDQRKGIGISNMQGRAESLNGLLTIESKPSAGCMLTLVVPLEETVEF
jgi:PAS domain S-box-containing protein